MSLPTMDTLFETYRQTRAPNEDAKLVLTNMQVIYNILHRYMNIPRIKFNKGLYDFNTRLLSLVGFVKHGEHDPPTRLAMLMTHHKISVDDIKCLTTIEHNIIPIDWDVHHDTQLIKSNMLQIMAYAKTSKYLQRATNKVG